MKGFSGQPITQDSVSYSWKKSSISLLGMSVSNDPQIFFQSTASLETLERRRKKSKNINGNPLILPAKILTFCVDFRQKKGSLPIVYTGESGGLARRVNLEVYKWY